MGIENLMTFMVTTLFFVMTPGMDTIFVLNKAIDQGRKSGIYATLGINTGVLLHTLFGALGLSVLLAKSDYAFALVKYIGAFYLIYLGFLKLINQKSFFPKKTNTIKRGSKNDFWSGFFTNTLNPKVALFFVAFFPQFIRSEQLNNPLPFIFLGGIYALMGMVWLLILTLFASAFKQQLKDHPTAGVWLNKLSGMVFILMGLKIIGG